MDRKKILIIAGAVVAVLLIGGLLWWLLRSPSGSGDEGPSKRDNIITLAREYMERDEYQRALDLLDGLLIEDASDEEARELRDRIIDLKKSYDEAKRLEDLKNLEDQQDQLRESLDQLGDTLQNQPSEIATAEALARQEELRLQREREQARQEEERKKEQELQRKVESLIQQGEDALRADEYESAVDFARQALLLDPASYKAANLKKRAEQAREDAESAAERKAREEKETAIETLYEQGLAALERESYTEARNKGEDIIDLDREDPRGHSLVGQATYLADSSSSASRDSAREHLEKAVSLDPSNWRNYAYLGEIAAADGDTKKAIDYMKKALSLNPQDASPGL